MISSSVFCLTQTICEHYIFVKPNLPMFPVVIGTREKLQRYFNLSSMKQDLIHSNSSVKYSWCCEFSKLGAFSGTREI